MLTAWMPSFKCSHPFLSTNTSARFVSPHGTFLPTWQDKVDNGQGTRSVQSLGKCTFLKSSRYRHGQLDSQQRRSSGNRPKVCHIKTLDQGGRPMWERIAARYPLVGSWPRRHCVGYCVPRRISIKDRLPSEERRERLETRGVHTDTHTVRLWLLSSLILGACVPTAFITCHEVEIEQSDHGADLPNERVLLPRAFSMSGMCKRGDRLRPLMTRACCSTVGQGVEAA